MTARTAIVLLAGAAIVAVPVCLPAAVFLGAGAAMVAADAADHDRRDARRRNQARPRR